MQYPTEPRETVVRKALAREMTQDELARTHGVSKSCVQLWLRKARERGEIAMVDGEKRARDWSAEERFAVLVETNGMNEEELGTWCRRHGLHSHELAQWRRDALAEAAPAAGANEKRARTTRLRQENAALRKELNRKDKALAETTALLVLQKNPHPVGRGRGAMRTVVRCTGVLIAPRHPHHGGAELAGGPHSQGDGGGLAAGAARDVGTVMRTTEPEWTRSPGPTPIDQRCVLRQPG